MKKLLKRLSFQRPRDPFFETTLDMQIEYDAKRTVALSNGKQPIPNVPLILQAFVDYFDRPEKGIFRTTGSMKDMKQYKEDIQKDGKINFLGKRDIDMVCMASLMKLWLRDITDGIVPKDLYVHFEAGVDSIENLKAAVSKLSIFHLETLKYTIGFLTKVQSYQNFNKMGFTNIAIVFGPCLFRCPCDNGPENTDQMKFMGESMKTSTFVKQLLTQYNEVFSAKTPIDLQKISLLPIAKSYLKTNLSSSDVPKDDLNGSIKNYAEIDKLIKNSVESFIGAPKDPSKPENLNDQKKHFSLTIGKPKEQNHPRRHSESSRMNSDNRFKQKVDEDQFVPGNGNKNYGEDNSSMNVSANESVPIIISRNNNHKNEIKCNKKEKSKVPERDTPPLPIKNIVDRPAHISVEHSNRDLTPTSSGPSSTALFTVNSLTPLDITDTNSPKPTTNNEEMLQTESSKSNEIFNNEPKNRLTPSTSTPTLGKIPNRPAPDTPKSSSPSKAPLKSPILNIQETSSKNSSFSTDIILKKSTSYDLSSSTSTNLELHINHQKSFSGESSFGSKMLSTERLSQSVKTAKMRLAPLANSNYEDSYMSEPNLNGFEKVESSLKKTNLSPLPKRNSITKETPTLYPKPHNSLTPLDQSFITPTYASLDERANLISKYRYYSNISVSDLTKEELREIKDAFKAIHRKIYENNTDTILHQDLVEYNSLKKIIKKWQKETDLKLTPQATSFATPVIAKTLANDAQTEEFADIATMTKEMINEEKNRLKDIITQSKKDHLEKNASIEERIALKVLYDRYILLKETLSALNHSSIESENNLRLELLKSRKRELQKKLHQHQGDFLKEKGRAVKSSEDMAPLEEEYREYKILKKEISDLENSNDH